MICCFGNQEEGVICPLGTYIKKQHTSQNVNMGMALGTKENARFKQLKEKWLGCEKKATLYCEIMRRVYSMYRLKFLHKLVCTRCSSLWDVWCWIFWAWVSQNLACFIRSTMQKKSPGILQPFQNVPIWGRVPHAELSFRLFWKALTPLRRDLGEYFNTSC